jgi:peptidoglycan/xylan/chitin deacetylase (PgdA/CDA1 family)
MQLLVVNFHYYREASGHNGIYPRNRSQLISQIDEMSRFYKFISQADLIEFLNGSIPLTGKFCLITFDDGLKEQMCALDELNSLGVPAVFYINSAPIRDKTVTNVHKLHHLRAKISDGDLYSYVESVCEREILFPDNIDSMYKYDDGPSRRIKYALNFGLSFEERTTVVNGLFDQLFDEKKLSHELYMSVEDLRKLSASGSLGNHTDQHLPLATLSKAAITAEISGATDYFKSIGVNADHSISYPFGGNAAVSDRVISCASQYQFGLTMKRGLNDLVPHDDSRLSLMRVDTNDAPGGKYDRGDFSS